MTIEWSPMVSVGVKIFDENNMRLIAAANRLDRAKIDKAWCDLEFCLCDIADYVSSQFDQEEYLMSRFDYSLIGCHLIEHQEFTENLTSIISDYEKFGECVIDTALTLVHGWLANHVFGADVEFGNFVRQRTPLLEAGIRLQRGTLAAGNFWHSSPVSNDFAHIAFDVEPT